MLTRLQTQPFQYIIANFKKIIQNKQIQKEQNQIKRSLRTLTQITNLNQLLTILLDYHWFNKLTSLIEKLSQITLNEGKSQKNLQTYEILPLSPLKTYDQNRQHFFNRAKKVQFTPSTKKSKVITNPTLPLLFEDLIQSLQKFDQIKPKAKRTKLLIEQLITQFSIDDNENRDFDNQVDIQRHWKELCEVDWKELIKRSVLKLDQDKLLYIKQLFQEIQTIYKFMQVIQQRTNLIFNLLQQKSIDQIENISQASQLNDSTTKKSQNFSGQRSLLTEMLKDSSQRSAIEIPQNQYSSQIILKSRAKQYSQREDLAFFDEHYRISRKSARPTRKLHQCLRSQMSCGEEANDAKNIEIKRREIKIKKREMGCSQCQIF